MDGAGKLGIKLRGSLVIQKIAGKLCNGRRREAVIRSGRQYL